MIINVTDNQFKCKSTKKRRALETTIDRYHTDSKCAIVELYIKNTYRLYRLRNDERRFSHSIASQLDAISVI